MRILICGINYYPEPTGIGKYTGEMGPWLSKQGHEVEVITAFPHYPSWEIDKSFIGKSYHKERIEGVTVYRTPLYVPPADNITTKNRIRLELSYAFNSLRYWIPIILNKKKYDVIIAVSPSMQSGILAYIYKLLRSVPLILHIQDLQVDAAVRLNMLNLGKLTKLLYGLENFLLNNSTIVSTITEAMRKRIVDKKVREEKTWLFPNWSDISFITPLDKENNEFRIQCGISNDDILYIYAGNIGEKQGLNLILDAANNVKDDPRIKFIIAGEGAAKSRLMEEASNRKIENIHFLPIQPLEKLPILLAAADVHLVIQKSEAADLVMPSKLTNILAAGRPVIATADLGTTLFEVIENNGIGRVGQPGDVSALVKNIKELSKSNNIRERMGRDARTYAEKYLDKDTVLKEFERKIINLLK